MPSAVDSARHDRPVRNLRRLQTALRMIELANAGAVDQLLELTQPDIVILSVPGIAPGPGYFGHAEVRAYFTAAAARGARAEAEVDRLKITANGSVFAAGRLSTTVDGATESLPAWFVYRFRNELLSAVETYLHRDCAWQQALTNA